MNKVFIPLISALLLFSSCSLLDQCDLTEQYTPSWTGFVLDKGHNKYEFSVSFDQLVKVYNGDCAAEKNINETRLKIKSSAPCDQIINLTIDVDLGPDSYQIKEDSLAIEANGTVDFGVVRTGGPRIDFAQIDIAIYCPLCPGDEG